MFYVRIDKNRKIPITSFIRAIGVKTDAEIKEMFGEDPLLLATLDKDPAHTSDEALIEIYKKMRPGEPPLCRVRDQPDGRNVLRHAAATIYPRLAAISITRSWTLPAASRATACSSLLSIR